MLWIDARAAAPTALFSRRRMIYTVEGVSLTLRAPGFAFCSTFGIVFGHASFVYFSVGGMTSGVFEFSPDCPLSARFLATEGESLPSVSLPERSSLRRRRLSLAPCHRIRSDPAAPRRKRRYRARPRQRTPLDCQLGSVARHT